MPEVVQMQRPRTGAPQKPGTDVTPYVQRVKEGAVYGGFAAMHSLGAVGEPAVPPLMELLTGADHNVRWRSAMALARVGAPSVDPLIEVAAAREESIKNPAIWALAEIGDERAVGPLIVIMREEPSDCCRAMTAAALIKLGAPAGVKAAHDECDRSGEDFRGLVREAYWGS